ncbi:MAG: hypothetical protein ACYC0V_21160, partial [Armatimonadota bacterium]
LPPSNMSLTPNSGCIAAGLRKILTSTFNDPAGYANIKTCYLLLNSSFTASDSGYFFYDAVKNKLYLRNPDNSVLIGGYAPGKAQIIDNGFIILDCARTTIQKSGNILTINWCISMKPSFAGTTSQAWMRVTNKTGQVDPWKQMGEFSVLPDPTPVNVSLTPNAGTLTIDERTTLTSEYSDAAGYLNIKSCYLMMNSGVTTTGAGYAFYDAVKNKLYLRQTGSSTMIGGFAPGSPNVINNGCITLYCADTSVQKSGNDITINWSIALKPYFTGSTCVASMQVTNKTGQVDPWEQMGSYSILSN